MAEPMSGGPNTERNTEGLQRRLKNLRPPWQPGQRSPNPSGRPRRSLGEIVVTKMLRSRVPEDSEHRRMIELIVRALCGRALKGDVDAARLLFERGYGRVALEPEFAPVTEIKVFVHTNTPVLRDGAEPIPNGVK